MERSDPHSWSVYGYNIVLVKSKEKANLVAKSFRSISVPTLLISIFGGLTIATVLIAFILPSDLVQRASLAITQITAPTANPNHTGPGWPIRLRVPTVKIDATVEPLSLDDKGAMQAPTTSIDVGWYKFGSYPGAEGTAVIDGHFGPWLRGGGSVFDNLGSLQKGDLIYVDDERGKTVTFVVTGSQVYDPNANDALVFTSHDDKSHLNLVTCGGDWNDTTQSFAKRLVVFADKQESSS